ncbi:MAG: type II toxin-antitoxin system VapC family toxin [Gaiellales bacterium]
MIVPDTSALVEALAARPRKPDLMRRLAGERLHAPYVVDVEFVQALRRLARHGEIGVDRATDARRDFELLPLIRYPHRPLLHRMWDLRDRLTAYDAAFVALAEMLDTPLVTCDAKLAAATGHGARIELYGA